MLVCAYKCELHNVLKGSESTVLELERNLYGNTCHSVRRGFHVDCLNMFVDVLCTTCVK